MTLAPPPLARPRRGALLLPLLLLLPMSESQGQQPRRAGGVEVVEATIPELQAAMAAGRVTAVELVDAYLARIGEYDERAPGLNAIVRLNPHARAEAALLDRERAERGPRGPLHGIPIILKDNFDTADLPTTGSSVALAGHLPPDDAFQVRRLREAGAIVLAKSNLHELAAGITTISSLGGQTLNPYDPARNPGGSSGGTAAAVAANLGVIGWGTDTCGSIRIPAALNSLFGLRPTKGLSSIDGIIPLSHTQDVAGPLARTATDLAIALDATIGPDPADPATRALEGRELPRFTASLHPAALAGARVGVLAEHFGDAPEDREMGRVVRAALDAMEALGATVLEVEVPGLDGLLSGTSLIGFEFKWDLMDYLAASPGAPVKSLGEILDRGLFHAELEARFRERNQVETRNSEPYLALLARREALRDAVLRVMDEQRLDAIAYPTMRRKAALIGEPAIGGNCQLSATTGMPALSVPAGFTPDEIPVGLELMGRPFDDARLVAMGYAFEQAGPRRRPPVLTPALVDGRAPATVSFETRATAAELVPAGGPSATARARFTFQPTPGTLEYSLSVDGAAERVHAVTLHRAPAGETGAVLHRLAGPGEGEASGSIRLGAAEREALLRGELYLQLYTREAPLGAARGQLRPPAATGGND